MATKIMNIKNKIIYLEVIAVIILLGGGLFMLLSSKDAVEEPPAQNTPQSSTSQIDYSPSTEEDAEYVAGIKEEITQEESESNPEENTRTYTITSSTLNGGELSVGTAITGSASGSCLVRVSDGTNNTESRSDILSANTNSGCINKIDISNLNASSDWTIVATASIDAVDSSSAVDNLQAKVTITAAQRSN